MNIVFGSRSQLALMISMPVSTPPKLNSTGHIYLHMVPRNPICRGVGGRNQNFGPLASGVKYPEHAMNSALS